MYNRIIYLSCFVLALLTQRIKAQEPEATTSLKWFTDLRFGMFIHWDMSSMLGTEISWSRGGTKPLDITGDPAGYVEDTLYDNLYKRFNPTKFNATKWVELAKAAGMKYIVFTTKHHGGFSNWDTRATDYSIMNTLYGRDIVKQLADACHKAGMKLGLYYSPRDWHHPEYGIGDNKEYVAFMNAQIRELLTNYGKIDIMWWDSYGIGDMKTFWQIDSTYHLMKRLQPDIIMNDRFMVFGSENRQPPPPYPGDFDTPEQRIGKFQNSRPWESCMTLVQTKDGGGFSYRKDGIVRTYKECIWSLISCAAGDGNLLLGIGPNETGIIPADQAERLLQIGGWLKKYGESIYQTRGGPYRNGDWGGATYNGNTIYLHIARWKGDTLQLPKLKSTILKFSNFTSPQNKISLTMDEKNMTITLPAIKQDSVDTIIVLELAGDAGNELINGVPVGK